jgi:hypothetical protein
MNQACRASDRLVPILALLLLETPLSWIGGFCHEGGHGLVALAQGGSFTGILFTQSGSYALASSYLVSIGGWVGQYTLAVVALLLYWRTRPTSFLGRSVLVVLIVQNLTNEPPYIASLQGDSAATLKLLEATGMGGLASESILEGAALLLGLVGTYVAWRAARTYLSSVFEWIAPRRATLASLFLVLGMAAYAWFADLVPSEIPLATNDLFQLVASVAFLLVFSLVVIPPRLAPTPRKWSGPSGVTLAFIVLLFTEAQLIYWFVLPLTIP